MKQIAVQVRNSSNVAVTGLVTADFSVRVSPYGGGNAISGLTATEIGVQGNYVISGFTAWYQNIKVYVSGVEQTWIGVQDVGDLTTAFMLLTTNQTVAGIKTFSSSPIIPNATTNLQPATYGQTAILARDNVFTANNFFTEIPRNTSGRAYSGSLYELADVKYLNDNYGTGSGTSIGINTNRLIVDSKQVTDVAGKIFNGIQEAITYAVTQTPSSTSRWTIIIMPHHLSTGYAEDITLSKFVDLVGWGGKVYINGTLTTTQITSAQDWSGARCVRLENIIVAGTDEAIYLRLLTCYNCIFKANGAGGEVIFYIDGSQLIDCGIYTQNDVDLQANNTELINVIANCFGNEIPTWETTDDVGSFTLMNSLIGL